MECSILEFGNYAVLRYSIGKLCIFQANVCVVPDSISQVSSNMETSPRRIPHLKRLPVEIRHQVLNHLPNVPTLWSCALVDRQLCREVMPLLWKDPLVGHWSTLRNVVGTYIPCLPRQVLRKCGVAKSIIVPTFDYPSFLRCLRTRNLW